jgi:hypothetical protein
MAGSKSPASAAGETKREQYLEFAERVRPHIVAAIKSGKTGHTEIARYLNHCRIRPHLGNRWTLASVRYLRERLDEVDGAKDR